MFRGIMNRLYNGNPNKPDLTPDDMPKSKLELYFACLGSRFGDLFKLNLLFLLGMLPFAVWTAVSLMAYIQTFANVEVFDEEVTRAMGATLQTYLWGCIPTLTLGGPTCAAMMAICRRIARDEHVFLWSDFKDYWKENWKQGMLTMFLFSTFVAFGVYAMRFYGSLGEGSALFGALQIVMMLLFLAVVLALLYVYPLMAAYEVKFADLLKNSFLLAFGRLPMTLLFTLLNLLPLIIGCVVFIYTPYALIVMVGFYAFFGFSLAAYTSAAYCNATFERYLPGDDDETDDEAAHDTNEAQDDPELL